MLIDLETEKKEKSLVILGLPILFDSSIVLTS